MSAPSTPTPEAAPFAPIDYTSWEATPEAARIADPLEKVQAYDNRLRKDLFKAGLYDADAESEIANAGADQALRAGLIADPSEYAPTAKPRDPNFLARQLVRQGDTAKAQDIYRYASFLGRPDTDPETLERARQAAEVDPETENELVHKAVRSGELPFAVVPGEDGKAVFEIDPELGALDRQQILDLAGDDIDPRFLPDLEKQLTRVPGTNYTPTQFRQAGVFDTFLKEQIKTDDFLFGELEKAQAEYDRTGQLSTETQESLDRTLAGLDADNEFTPATRGRLIRDTIRRGSKPEAYDPENPGQHIQYLEDGTAWLPEQTIFDAAKHDALVDSLSITPEQKEAAKKLRAGRFESIAPAMVDAMGANPEAFAFWESSKAAGKTDSEIATEWYSKPENYSWWGNRARSIGMSLLEAGPGLFQAIGALAGSESAREAIQARQQDMARNEEFARLSGDRYGVGMSTLNAVTPMVVDLLAGIGVSLVASPVAGVAVAGARTAASSLVRSIARTAVTEGARGAVRSFVRNGAESAARTLATLGDDLVSDMARKVGGEVAEQAAIRGAARSIGGQTGVAASSFTRSAGSGYVQAYSALDAQTNPAGQPLYSDEEKRKIALGAAITQGTATAAITLGFGKILGGGVEDLVTGKIGTGILKRVYGATDEQIVAATRTSAMAILSAAGAEAPEEAADQLVGNVIQALGTGEEFRLGPALKEALEAGLVGGLLGAGTKSIEVGIDKYRNAKVVALEKANAPASAAALEAKTKAAATTPAAKPTVINQDGLRIQENPPLSPDPFSYGEEDPDAPNPALTPSAPPSYEPGDLAAGYGDEPAVGITDTGGAVRVSAAEIEGQIDAVDVQIADLKIVPASETEGQKVRRTRKLQELNAEKVRLKSAVKNAKASGGFVLVNTTNTTAEQAAITAEAEVAALDEEIAALSVAPAKETKAAATKREASLEQVRVARAEAAAVAQTRRAAAPIPRGAEGQSDPRALDYGDGGELAAQDNALGAPDFAPTPARQRGTGGAELTTQDNALASTEAVPDDIVGTDQAPEPPDVEVVPEPGEGELDYGDGSPLTVQDNPLGGPAPKPETTKATKFSRKARALVERLLTPESRSQPPEYLQQQKAFTPTQTAIQSRIAALYEALPVDDSANPEVVQAYQNLVTEVVAQYRAMLETGIKIEMGSENPYATSGDMINDVERGRLWIYKTEPGSYGSDAMLNAGNHPMLAPTEFTDLNGEPMLANDVFRAVHDYVAHAAFGFSFGPLGEEAAWKAHLSTLRDPLARLALTTETRGQNSWVNYRPEMVRDGMPLKKGDPGYIAPQDRPFATQKFALLPEEAMTLVPIVAAAKTKKPTDASLAAEMRAGNPLPIHETLFNDTISQGWVPTRNTLLSQLKDAGFGGKTYGKAFAETVEARVRELYPVTDVSKQKGVVFKTLDSLGFGDIKGPDNKTVKIPMFADDNTSGPFTNDPQTTAWQKNAGLSVKVPDGVAVNPAIKVNPRTGFVDYSTHNTGARIYAKGDFKRAGNTIGSYIAFQNKTGFGASLETLPPFDSSKLAGPVDFAGMRIIPGETTEDDVLRFYFAPSSDGGPSKIESAINASASGMSAVDKDQIRAAAQLSFVRELREFTLDMNDVGSVNPEGFLRTPDGYKAGIENRIANVWSKADRGKDGVIDTSKHWNERGRPSHLAFFVKTAIAAQESGNEIRPDANVQLGSDDVDQATALERAAARNETDNAADVLVALDEAFTPEVLRGSAALMGMTPETGIVDIASGIQILVSRIDTVPALRKAFEQAYLGTLDLPPGPSAKRAVAIQRAKVMDATDLVVLAARSALVQPGVVQAVREAGFFKSISYGLSTFTDAEIEQHRADNRAAIADLQLDGDLRSAIERIARSAKYPRRYRAAMLAALKMQVLPNLSIVDAPAEAYAGSYIHSGRLITLNIASSNGRGMLDVLAHELLHAATLEAIANPQTKAAKDLLAKLERARQKAAEVIPDDMAYAVSSIDEFITHAATDPRLQVILRETFEKGKTTWQRVVDAIAKFFGIANSDFVSDLWGFINHAAEYGLRPGVAASREQRSMPGTDWARTDAEYLAAVAAGDMVTAQRMVDEAARAAGFSTVPMYHGTQQTGFTEFRQTGAPNGDVLGEAFYFTDDEAHARTYAEEKMPTDADWMEWMSNFNDRGQPLAPEGGVYKTYLKFSNPADVTESASPTRDARSARSRGHDAVIYRAPRAAPTDRGFEMGLREVAVFSPEQIKSADPVTRDDAGNVIPLSARFRPSSPDIRYTIGSVHDALKTRETGAALPRGVKTLPGMSDNPESSTVEKQFENLDEIFATIPNPIASQGSWITFMRAIGKQLGKKTPVPIAPDRAVGYSAGRGFDHIMVDLKQHPEYVEARTQGLATGTRMLEDFRSGKLGRQDLASLFLWGLFSRGIGAYPQEGAFSAIHRAGLLDKLEQTFTGQMTPVELRDWALESAKGSPVGGAHRNVKAIDAMLNALTYKFDGRLAIDVLLDAWKSDMTGPQLRREVYRMFTKDRPSLQIQNKVLSFIILVSGRPDVLVLDRVQFRHLWGGEKLESIIENFKRSVAKAKAATLRRADVKSSAELQKAIADVVPERTDNVYDRLPVLTTPEAEAKAIEAHAEIKAFGSYWATVLEFVNPKPAGTFGFVKVSGKKKVARSGLVGLGNGLHGLAAYEAIERGLSAATEQAYRDAGIEYPGIGAFHWDSWLVSSRQAISHPTLELIAGSRDPGTSVMEGKFNTINYGMLYRYDGMYMRELLTNPGHYVMLTPEAAKSAYTTAAVNKALGRKGKNQLKLKKSEELEDDEDGPQERTRPWTEDLSPAERSAFDKWLRTLGPTVEPDPDALADGDPDGRGDAGLEDRPDEVVRAALTPEGAAPDGSRGSVDQYLPTLPAGVSYEFDDSRPKYLAYARRSKPGIVTINKAALAAAIEGLSPANARAIVSKVVKHEIAHLAAFSAFTDAEIAEMSAGLSMSEIGDIARRYYNSPDAMARLTADLGSGAITNEALVEEYLRMQAEMISDGATTEETIAFHSTNPGFAARLLRYIRDFVKSLWSQVAGPTEDYLTRVTINRLMREYRDIKRGHLPPVQPPFDPGDPYRDNRLGALATTDGTDPEAAVLSDFMRQETFIDFSGAYTEPAAGWRGTLKQILKTRSGDPRFDATKNERTARITAANTLLANREKAMRRAMKEEKPDRDLVNQALGDKSPSIPMGVRKDLKAQFEADLQDVAAASADKQADIDVEFTKKLAAGESRDSAVDWLVIEQNKLEASEKAARQEAYDKYDRARRQALAETAREKKARVSEAFDALRAEHPKTADAVKKFRAVIDSMSAVMRDTHPEDSFLHAVLDEQMGVYVTTSYRIHHGDADPLAIFKSEDPGDIATVAEAQELFIKTIIEGRTEDIMEEEAEAGKIISFAEAEELARAWANENDLGRKALENYIASHGSRAFYHGGGNFKIDLTRYMQKGDVPEALRKVLGEIDDPVENAARTFANVSYMAANHRFIEDLARGGKASGALVTKAQKDVFPDMVREPNEDAYIQSTIDNGFARRRSADGYVQVADGVFHPLWLLAARENRDFRKLDAYESLATTNKKYGAGSLDGLYAAPLVKAFFDNVMPAQPTLESEKMVHRFGSFFAKATGASLGIATVTNPGFHTRNMLGGSFFLMANGINPFSGLGIVGEHFRDLVKGQDNAEVLKRIALGIYSNDTRPQAIKELIKDETDKPGDRSGFEWLGNLIGGKRGLDIGQKITTGALKLTDFAGAVDSAVKGMAYEKELRTLQEAHPDWEPAKIERAAADVVLRTHQARSMTVPIAEDVTRSSFGRLFSPFLRFRAEMFRVTHGTITQAIEEIKSDNPVIQARGRERMAGFIMVSALSLAGPALVSAMFGVGGDEEEALRESLPPYLKGNSLTYFVSGGSVTSLDMTFVNPYSNLFDPISRTSRALFRGEPGDAAGEVAAWMSGQLLDEQIAAGAALEVLNNRTSDNKPIVLDTDGFVESTVKYSKHLLGSAYTPQVLKTIDRAIDAQRRGVPETAEMFETPAGLLASSVLPVRGRTFQTSDMALRAFKSKAQTLRDIRTLSGQYKRRQNLDETDINGITGDIHDSMVSLYEDLDQIARGFEGLGMSKADVIKQMVNAGHSREKARGVVVRGVVPAPSLTPATKRDVFDAGEAVAPNGGGERRVRLVRESQQALPRTIDLRGPAED